VEISCKISYYDSDKTPVLLSILVLTSVSHGYTQTVGILW
jgi:hypothetical protein